MNLDEIAKGLADGTLIECPHCNGYGSSLKEEADRCTRCGGSGVIPKEKK
jgi:DnaJ-class molecular chaperone